MKIGKGMHGLCLNSEASGDGQYRTGQKSDLGFITWKRQHTPMEFRYWKDPWYDLKDEYFYDVE